jgi:DNA-binding transcriptional MocR family regulator
VAVRYQPSGTTAAAISASVETGIRAGRLLPGAILPPVRALAAELGISPATVAAAYRGLRDRGLVETGGRAGTRVRARPPVALRMARLPQPPPGVVDLASGAPDPTLLPSLRRRPIDGRPVNYGHGQPLAELLDVARERFGTDRVPAAHLTVTGGALDGIERMLVAHLRPGDRVAVEDPGWANVFDLVAALGLTPVSMPVDAAGPTEDGLRAALATGVAAVIVTSRAQNPTGAVVTATRARALRRLLRQYPKILIIEDDHAAELSHDDTHPLVGVTESWAYVRSVSKPYGPDLRLAVLAGDEASVARVEGRMRLGTGWVSTILQRLVLALWCDPRVAAAVARAKETYAERRLTLRACLDRAGVESFGAGGINVWVPVADETRVVSGLREEGYAVAPGSLFRLASAPGVRITTAALAVGDAPRVALAVQRVTSVASPRWY